jgi:PAS domain-containing protein
MREQVCALHVENMKMKETLRRRLVDTELLEQILKGPELPDAVNSLIKAALRQTNEGGALILRAALQKVQRCFCIANASVPDNPIVYASSGFLELTGYDLPSVLGRNCRFLQGPDTDRIEVRTHIHDEVILL